MAKVKQSITDIIEAKNTAKVLILNATKFIKINGKVKVKYVKHGESNIK